MKGHQLGISNLMVFCREFAEVVMVLGPFKEHAFRNFGL